MGPRPCGLTILNKNASLQDAYSPTPVDCRTEMVFNLKIIGDLNLSFLLLVLDRRKNQQFNKAVINFVNLHCTHFLNYSDYCMHLGFSETFPPNDKTETRASLKT